MAKSSTPTFITTIPLKVDNRAEAELVSRFQAGRQLYNAVLSEAMVRMNLVRKSDLYQQAKKLPRGQGRTQQFTVARKTYRYSDYDLQAYATIVANRSQWIATKIDSNTQQKLATRAFKASERVMLGLAKKVRFKVPSQFKSLEGKTNAQGIRWKNNQLVWCGLKLRPKLDLDNPVIQHGLNSPIKYVRILFKEIQGKRRWYVQLINEGTTYQKPANYVTTGTIGLDLNVSNVAYVGDNQAGLLPFAENVPTFESEIKLIQRQLQRSQRANNPQNYHPDILGKKGRRTVLKQGQVKAGRQDWYQSKRYHKLASKKRELERRKSAYSQSQNRRLVNEILRHGHQIKTERVSVKGWQKRYGKAIAAKSPGFFQSELKRKAASAGGSFYQFSTQTTALSQTHLSGNRVKKSLSERIHLDETGITMHRDLFSAFLSRYVNDDELSVQDASNSYPGLEPILVEAWKQYQQTANRVSVSESGQCHSPFERFSQQLETVDQIAIRRAKS